MNNLVFDVETIPLPISELEAMMPEGLKNPEAYVSEPMPDFMEKCPKYGGDEAKRSEWVKAKQDDWKRQEEASKAKHALSIEEKRQKFIADAALDARTAKIKLIGLKRPNGETTILVADATEGERKHIEEGAYSRTGMDIIFATEAGVLAVMWDRCKTDYRNGDVKFDRFVGYYIENFDLPFLFHRSWILGVRPFMGLRKGRYWDDIRVLDLHSMWQMGDKQRRTGGLDGLAHALGVKRKSADGSGFYKMWEEDPAKAVQYLITDLEVTEETAKKMGVV